MSSGSTAQRRYHTYYLEFARAHSNAPERVDIEYAQIVRVFGQLRDSDLILSFGTALNHYQMQRGAWSDALAWCKRAHEVAVTENQWLAAGQFAHTMASLYLQTGRVNEAGHYFTVSNEIFQRLNNVDGVLAVDIGQGALALARGDYETVVEISKTCLELASSVDMKIRAHVYHNLGMMYHQQGDWQTAIQQFQSAVDAYRQIPDHEGTANSLGGMAIAYQAMGKWQIATRLQEKALAIWEELGDLPGVGRSQNNLGVLHAARQLWPPALEYYRLAVVTFETAGDPINRSLALNNIGEVYRQQTDFSNALQYFTSALDIAQSTDSQHVMLRILNNLSAVYIMQMELVHAKAYAEQTLELSIRMQNTHAQASAHQNLGVIAENQRAWPSAAHHYRQALTIFEKADSQPNVAQVWYNLGNVLCEQGSEAEAISCYKTSCLIFAELEDAPRHCLALYNLAATYENMGRVIEAVGCYRTCVLQAGLCHNFDITVAVCRRLLLIFGEQKKWVAAQEVLQGVLANLYLEGHQRGVILELLGSSYASHAQWRQAQIVWKQAVEFLLPDSVEYKHTTRALGRVRFLTWLG
jgi:tetratricopeptide (TPR) repeat protein